MRYLEKNVYVSSERNYRTPHSEIDLIVHGTWAGDVEAAVVFIEVKLQHGTGFGDPLETVTPKNAGQDTPHR